jgi:hypothetical protein
LHATDPLFSVKQGRRTPNRGCGSGKKEKKDLSETVNDFLERSRSVAEEPSKKKKTQRNIARQAGYEVNACIVANSHYY